MASEDDLLLSLLGDNPTRTTGSADINALERTIRDNNYWRKAATPILGAKFDTSTWTPNQTLGTLSGQAFLGSILNAIGQRSEENQLDKVSQILPQLYANPASVGTPEGVDRTAFAGLKMDALSKKRQEDEDIRKAFAINYGASIDPRSGKVGSLPGFDELFTESGGGRGRKGDSAAREKQILEEKKSVGDLEKSLSFIDDKFEQAKKITGKEGFQASLGSLGLPTPGANELTGIADSVIVQIDKALGREVNSDVRKRLLTLTPRWYDSDAEVDRKKQDLKELVYSLSQTTPLTGGLTEDIVRGQTESSNTMPSSVPEGMKLQRNKRTGEIRMVPK